MNEFNDRPEGGDEAEGGEDETVIDDEDDFSVYLNHTVDGLNEAKTSSFRDENKNDKYRRRKEQINRLYLIGNFNDMNGEFAKKLLRSEYRIDRRTKFHGIYLSFRRN